MKLQQRWLKVLLACLSLVIFAMPGTASAAAPQNGSGQSPKVTVFARGLNDPRGLKFGPDGRLYVAEAGLGGGKYSTTAQQCQQVPFPVGPYTGGDPTARISRIDRSGRRTTIADHLPASQASAIVGGDKQGVADIAFIGRTLYALVAGAGCSHGLAGTHNGIVRIDPGGKATYIADLSAFWQAHPVKNPDAGDFEPDGTPYSMLAVSGNLFVIEPNHGELDRVSPDGKTERVVDFSASLGHFVPTAQAFRSGSFYVSNLGTFPVKVGSSKILKVSRSGEISQIAGGLTTVLGVAFDREGRLYALETSVAAGSQGPAKDTGRIVRMDRKTGALTEVVAGLSDPTAMIFGPDGSLYVSNKGYHYGPGEGEILRIRLPREDD